MSEPIGPQNLGHIPAAPTPSIGTPNAPSAKGTEGSFKETLLESLEEVNRLQMEATEGVEKLAIGETNNVAEVFSAVRKADIAFSMLMEMRNKLVEAYREIQQMRV